MGRRRIEIKKIEDLKARQVCFSKRRQGLFKKAQELSRLCDVNVLAIVFSPAGRPFVFSAGDTSRSSPELMLDNDLRRNSPSSSLNGEEKVSPWWSIDVAGIPENDLRAHYEALQRMKSEVMTRLEKAKMVASSHCYGQWRQCSGNPHFENDLQNPNFDELLNTRLEEAKMEWWSQTPLFASDIRNPAETGTMGDGTANPFSVTDNLCLTSATIDENSIAGQSGLFVEELYGSSTENLSSEISDEQQMEEYCVGWSPITRMILTSDR